MCVEYDPVQGERMEIGGFILLKMKKVCRQNENKNK